MANPEHLKNLQEGVKSWNKWREENPGIKPDLSGINLTSEQTAGACWNKAMGRAWLSYIGENGTDIGINFSRAELGGVDLSDVEAEGAHFTGANLMEAKLRNANLQRADFRDASLWKADLSNAELRWADLSQAKLWQTNLSEANLWEADCLNAEFVEADLSSAKLRWTDVSNASFEGAKLVDTDLGGAILFNADFFTARLRGTLVFMEQFELVEINHLCALFLENGGDIKALRPPCRQTNGCNAGPKEMEEFLKKKITRMYSRSGSRELLTLVFENTWNGLIRNYTKREALGKRFFKRAREVYLALKVNWNSLGRYDDASWAGRKEKEIEGELLRVGALVDAERSKNKWLNCFVKAWLWCQGLSLLRYLLVWVPLLLASAFTYLALPFGLNPFWIGAALPIALFVMAAIFHFLPESSGLVGVTKKLFEYTGNRFYDWLCDYGENPWEIVWHSVALIFYFSLWFGVLGVKSQDGSVFFSFFPVQTTRVFQVQPLPTLLYFSLTAFTAGAFGDLIPTNLESQLLAGSECLIGLFLTALFIWTLSRRVGAR